MKTWAELLAAKPAFAAMLLSASKDEEARAFLAEMDAPTELIEAVLVERAKAASLKAADPPAPPDPAPAPAKKCECGAPIVAGAKFCASCGTNLEMAAKPPAPTPAPAPVPAVVKDNGAADRAEAAAKEALATAKAIQESMRQGARTATVNSLLASFDAPTQTHLRPQLEKEPTDAGMVSLVEAHKRFIGSLTEAAPFPTGTVRDAGGVSGGSDSFDTYNLAFAGYFAGEDQKDASGRKVPRFRTLREAAMQQPRHRGRYVQYDPLDLFRECRGWYHGGYKHGQAGSFGLREAGRVVRLTESNGAWLRESATTVTFADVWADNAYKRMQMKYISSNSVKEVEEWATSREELEDFKTHHFIRLGEYANPNSVAEGGTYQPATSPADQDETGSLVKYGFFEDITMEALLGEDGSHLRTLPDRMIEAIIRLERETLIDSFTKTNPTLASDSVALYSAAATRTNLLTAALSVSQLAVIERAMMQQTSLTAAKQLGSVNRPWGIVHPPELLQLVDRIVNPSAAYTVAMNNDTNTTLDPWLWKGRLKSLCADHFTNATDFYVSADPKRMPTWILARLRGVSGPEFFTQDSEDAPSMFDSDKIKWKVRTFFAGIVQDFRGLHWSDVP